MRDCENCKHRVMKVEVGKGTPPEHFWGCECWECEFEPTTKNDLGVDCINRQAVIDLMMQKWGENFSGDDAMQESIDAIRVMPSVTPQEPKTEWEHDHELLNAYSDGMREVLDKIRAEIKPKCDRINSLASVLSYTSHREIQELLCDIMDLCKAESEIDNGND